MITEVVVLYEKEDLRVEGFKRTPTSYRMPRTKPVSTPEVLKVENGAE